MMELSLQELRASAESFAREAGEWTLRYFRKSYAVEFKGDDSPVTNADREAEQILRERIREAFPEHGIIGEEFGSERPDADVVWVLDPIDGTQSFIHGVSLYTTLIGILIKNEPMVGVIYAPAQDELASAAIGFGCSYNGKTASVRPCADLADATFLSTDATTFRMEGVQRPFTELLQKTRIHRTWGDAYGHMMVATGRADVMVDPILNIWDAAALLPIVTEAGGVFMDRNGDETIHTGNAISCAPELKPMIVATFTDE
ncbi:MAG: inositol monophosphatase family protein [Balneolaceae bacterium]